MYEEILDIKEKLQKITIVNDEQDINYTNDSVVMKYKKKHGKQIEIYI